MQKNIEVTDEESGIVLKYNWDDLTGWDFAGSGYSSVDERRKAVKLALKYWPETPEEYKEKIEKNNKDILDFCRSFKG